MKKYKSFLSAKFRFLKVKLSIYMNRHVFVMRLLPYVVASQELRLLFF